MSLSIFAIKNQWHKNGKKEDIKVFGGSPKCSIELLEKKDITLSE